MKDLATIADEINAAAAVHPRMQDFQAIRQRLHGLSRVKTRRIFSEQTINDYYAFHSGGRRELQYNIGFEEDSQSFRYGVAFSLEPSQSLPNPLVLQPKIIRFNSYIRKNIAALRDLRFWFYDDRRSPAKSRNMTVGPIPDHLVDPPNFLFLGKLVRRADVDPTAVVALFDRLLELYEYVEGTASSPPVTVSRKIVRVSPLVFDREFSRFKSQIRANSNGEEFISFHEGLAATWEGYKERVRDEALQRLQVSSWKLKDVGDGRILKRAIDAIEINEHPQLLRNNLVAWPNRYGHASRAHSALLDAQNDARARRPFEQAFYDLFSGARSDQELFESFRGLVGKRYDLIAYFFFLKDWTRFMPIATQTFDAAFRHLEIDLITAHRCSWENYELYNDAMHAVQRRLQDVGGIENARLIDAHSFCWILTRLEAPESAEVAIPLPRPMTGLRPVVPDQTADVGNKGFAQVNEAWFVERDENRRRVGKLAQDIALQSEQRRLREAGHADPIAAATPVWDEPARGYDILSCERDGSPRHIEVKAARLSGGLWSFFLTPNEFAKSRTLPNYYFYLVFAVGSQTPDVRIVISKEVVRECLTPVSYTASLSVP